MSDRWKTGRANSHQEIEERMNRVAEEIEAQLPHLRAQSVLEIVAVIEVGLSVRTDATLQHIELSLRDVVDAMDQAGSTLVEIRDAILRLANR